MEEKRKLVTSAISGVQLQKTRRERTNLCKVLPTDRIAFDKQVNILRAYAASYEANGGNPVTNDQAGSTVTPKFSGSTLVMAVPFFADIGLLIRAEGGKFAPSSELVAFNKTLQWNESEAKEKLRPVFERTWFYRCLVPRLQLAPQTLAACIAVLADESKAEKEHEQRLNHLINFLEVSGIISVAGGTVSLTQPRPTTPTQESNERESNVAKARSKSDADADEHTLFLDKDRQRKVTLVAPLSMTRSEYERLCKWIEVTLIVEDEKK